MTDDQSASEVQVEAERVNAKAARRREREVRERQRIVNAIASGDDDGLLARVAALLSRNSEARDSDRILLHRFWEEYEPELYLRLCTGDIAAHHQLTREISISRARARIQNTHGLFVASPEVQSARRQLSEDERERLANAPRASSVLPVYADETGKTGQTLIVSSIWLANGRESASVARAVARWQSDAGRDEEFHFSNMGRNDVERYVEFFELVVVTAPSLSFKSIQVAKTGVRSVEHAMPRLISELLSAGLQHEHESGRVTLPRSLLLFKDADGEGADRLCLAEVRQQLEHASTYRFGGQLGIDGLEAVDSKTSALIQAADLYGGSIQRQLERKGRNHKDEFADYVIGKISAMAGIDQGQFLSLGEAGDIAVTLRL